MLNQIRWQRNSLIGKSAWSILLTAATWALASGVSAQTQGSGSKAGTSRMAGSSSKQTPRYLLGNKTPESGPKIKKVVKTEAQWREQLDEMAYYVTREKGTERAFTGRYWDHKRDGVYTCACCGMPLFDAKQKFKSGTGWPSYSAPIYAQSVANIKDLSHGMVRVEVVCSRCDAHLGHVFNDGPRPSGLRYCMNSASLNFLERKSAEKFLSSKENPLREQKRMLERAPAESSTGGQGSGSRTKPENSASGGSNR